MNGTDMKAAFTKSPQELIDRFGLVMDRFPQVERRKMFGYPAAFVNGQMVTALFADRWSVRLPDDARQELLGIEGSALFEPMPGRPMKEYAVFPASMIENPDSLVPWIERAIGYVAKLPPKPSAKKR